jgi:hypothetical protein
VARVEEFDVVQRLASAVSPVEAEFQENADVSATLKAKQFPDGSGAVMEEFYSNSGAKERICEDRSPVPDKPVPSAANMASAAERLADLG